MIDVVSNISFVVVAKDEEYGIGKCLKSICRMNLIDCEIICVDSGSSDKTLEIMSSFCGKIKNLKIYTCDGYSNSSIARNIGLSASSKNVIFFVDGDVELNFDFMVRGQRYIRDGICDIVTGQLSEVYYDNMYERKISFVKDRFGINTERIVLYSGGCFMVNRSIVEISGSWDVKMERNQDIDYTLRLSRHGKFIAIPFSMGIHHTQKYDFRAFYFLKKLFPMFFGMIIRRNIDRPRAIVELFRNNYGYAVGIVVYFFLIASIFFMGADLLIFSSLSCVAAIIIYDLYKCITMGKNILNNFCTHYLYPIVIIAGIFMDRNACVGSTKIKHVYGVDNGKVYAD